jgi:hypothetical protein
VELCVDNPLPIRRVPFIHKRGIGFVLDFRRKKNSRWMEFAPPATVVPIGKPIRIQPGILVAGGANSIQRHLFYEKIHASPSFLTSLFVIRYSYPE